MTGMIAKDKAAKLLAYLEAERQDELDALTKANTAWKSFQEFVDADYIPTLYMDITGCRKLANAYDQHQEERGDSRRVFRMGENYPAPDAGQDADQLSQIAAEIVNKRGFFPAEKRAIPRRFSSADGSELRIWAESGVVYVSIQRADKPELGRLQWSYAAGSNKRHHIISEILPYICI